ncbi:MAG: S41 family peptidase [Myxococcota bacterium]
MLAASLGWMLSSGCAPDDPFDVAGPRSCEIPDQNEWVYSLMQRMYLFADEMPEVDPLEYETPQALMADLRVEPDRWSRISDKVTTNALFQEGKQVGTGFRTRRDPQGRVVVAEIKNDSPASALGMRRGDIVQSVGGLAVERIDEESLWGDIYGENVPGVTVEIQLEQADGEVLPVSLTKDWIDIETVPLHDILEHDGQPVGYIYFASFLSSGPEELNAAFGDFRAADVRQVVVDLRYNSGGLVSVARHFMHLLAGGVAEGRTAYKVMYNDALAAENTNRTLSRLDNSLTEVDHVVFITTGTSISASELLINGVAAHIPVSIVGDDTGGKPVGSKHFEFCDSIARPITFQVLNADDYGNYFDGLSVDCPAPDDLTRDLGDPEETSLAVALHRLSTGECLDVPEAEEAGLPEPFGLRTPVPATDGEQSLPLGMH